jgi:hypothetical protein
MSFLKRWFGALAVFLFLVLASPLLLPVVVTLPITYYWRHWRTNQIRREFGQRWGSEGKRGILVYSNSPHWKAHINQHWLPRVGKYVVVMNWSEKTKWHSTSPLEANVFHRFAGDREFNPLAIIFPEPRTPLRTLLADAWRRKDPVALLFPNTNVEVIRFWMAFRDFKHGRRSSLRTAEKKLFDALRVSPPPDWNAAEKRLQL